MEDYAQKLVVHGFVVVPLLHEEEVDAARAGVLEGLVSAPEWRGDGRHFRVRTSDPPLSESRDVMHSLVHPPWLAPDVVLTDRQRSKQAKVRAKLQETSATHIQLWEQHTPRADGACHFSSVLHHRAVHAVRERYAAFVTGFAPYILRAAAASLDDRLKGVQRHPRDGRVTLHDKPVRVRPFFKAPLVQAVQPGSQPSVPWHRAPIDDEAFMDPAIHFGGWIALGTPVGFDQALRVVDNSSLWRAQLTPEDMEVDTREAQARFLHSHRDAPHRFPVRVPLGHAIIYDATILQAAPFLLQPQPHQRAQGGGVDTGEDNHTKAVDKSALHDAAPLVRLNTGFTLSTSAECGLEGLTRALQTQGPVPLPSGQSMQMRTEYLRQKRPLELQAYARRLVASCRTTTRREMRSAFGGKLPAPVTMEMEMPTVLCPSLQVLGRTGSTAEYSTSWYRLHRVGRVVTAATAVTPTARQGMIEDAFGDSDSDSNSESDSDSDTDSVGDVGDHTSGKDSDGRSGVHTHREDRGSDSSHESDTTEGTRSSGVVDDGSTGHARPGSIENVRGNSSSEEEDAEGNGWAVQQHDNSTNSSDDEDGRHSSTALTGDTHYQRTSTVVEKNERAEAYNTDNTTSKENDTTTSDEEYTAAQAPQEDRHPNRDVSITVQVMRDAMGRHGTGRAMEDMWEVRRRCMTQTAQRALAPLRADNAHTERIAALQERIQHYERKLEQMKRKLQELVEQVV